MRRWSSSTRLRPSNSRGCWGREAGVNGGPVSRHGRQGGPGPLGGRAAHALRKREGYDAKGTDDPDPLHPPTAGLHDRVQQGGRHPCTLGATGGWGCRGEGLPRLSLSPRRPRMGLRWVGCRLFEASKRLRPTPMGRDSGGATLEELLAERITGNIAAALDRAVERLSEGGPPQGMADPRAGARVPRPHAQAARALRPQAAVALPARARGQVSCLRAGRGAGGRGAPGDQRRQCSLRRENRRRRAGRGR